MWNFIKTLAKAIYRNTVGGLVRMFRHTRDAKIDNEDKQFVGRLLVYTAFGIGMWLFPLFTTALLALRIMLFSDIFRIIADIYGDVANAYS